MSDHDIVDHGLNDRQEAFVDAYMGDARGNGTKAARLAGYNGSDNTLAAQAWALLRNPKVRAALDARMECDPLIAGRVERLRFLTDVLRGKVADTGEVEGVTVEVPAKLADRLKAYELLSKAAGEHLPKLQTPEGETLLAGITVADLITLANASRGK